MEQNDKTQKMRMINGELYNINDEELIKEREKAQIFCYEYNKLRYAESEKKTKLLESFLGKVGKGAIIETNFFCDYGYNFKCGENFYANHGLIALDGAEISIGNNVFLGPDCGFYTKNPPRNFDDLNNGIYSNSKITIGNNVWLGGGVIICPGVTIGNNVTIGAGSVVISDIPSNVTAVGNPCKVIKENKENIGYV